MTNKNNSGIDTDQTRLIIKVSRELLPQVKDKFPFFYLERGRLEVDDSSVKWISCNCEVIRLPLATINCLLLGPGTSVTHEAVKVIAATNCLLCWVGEDSMHYYASGQSPVSNSRNFRRQMKLSSDSKKSLSIAKQLFSKRFPDSELEGKTLKQLMAMEGYRIKQLYQQKAEEYQVGWKGRIYVPGKFELGDITNRILTASNALLYAISSACIHGMGYSPHIGFIHSGSPLPFVYDLADLYKEQLSIDLAFALTLKMAGVYNQSLLRNDFRERALQMDLVKKIVDDIDSLLGAK